MSNHLTNITIKNFKCFAEKTIPLNQLTVLAGGNSVGKSTVIQAFLLAKSALDSIGPLHLKTSNDENRVSLNNSYLLNLGNTDHVFNKKENPNIRIFLVKSPNENLGFSYTGNVLTLSQYLDFNIWGSDFKGFPILKPLYYLNAERIGPRLSQNIQSYSYLHCGWQGENTIGVLNELDTNFDVVKERFFKNTENPSIRFQTNAWMKFIIPDVKIDFEAFKTINTTRVSFNDRNPYNVGFGISYILPIIVSGLIAEEGSIFIVENPEAHLHPYGQSKMGQFLAVVAASGVQVIVETHSEHLINGMRVRVASIQGEIAHDAITINFFSKKIDENENAQYDVRQISIDDSADLSAYPLGFFDQALRDQSEIIKTKRAKQQPK